MLSSITNCAATANVSGSTHIGGLVGHALDGDNSAVIALADEYVADVTLSDYTLYRDGRWHTLCLPFNLAKTEGTPLEGASGASGWYALDGQRLAGKPAKKGVYIHNGKKAVVK